MFLWNIAVTSLAEVWIETLIARRTPRSVSVTSLAEVWIETEAVHREMSNRFGSLPLRKCGLKPVTTSRFRVKTGVTSLAEVWIETANCFGKSRS